MPNYVGSLADQKVGYVSGGDLIPFFGEMVHKINRSNFDDKPVAWVLLSDLMENLTYATKEYLRELCANPNRWYPTGKYQLIILTDAATSNKYRDSPIQLDRHLRSYQIADYEFESCRHPQNWAKQNEFKDNPADWFQEFMKVNYRHGDKLITLPLPDDEDAQPGRARPSTQDYISFLMSFIDSGLSWPLYTISIAFRFRVLGAAALVYSLVAGSGPIIKVEVQSED